MCTLVQTHTQLMSQFNQESDSGHFSTFMIVFAPTCCKKYVNCADTGSRSNSFVWEPRLRTVTQIQCISPHLNLMLWYSNRCSTWGVNSDEECQKKTRRMSAWAVLISLVVIFLLKSEQFEQIQNKMLLHHQGSHQFDLWQCFQMSASVRTRPLTLWTLFSCWGRHHACLVWLMLNPGDCPLLMRPDAS